MQVEVMLFAQLADLFQKEKITVDGVNDVELLLTHLKEIKSELEDHKFSVAVNGQIEKDNVALKDGDEVALLPPFAGG